MGATSCNFLREFKSALGFYWGYDGLSWDTVRLAWNAAKLERRDADHRNAERHADK